VIRRAIRRTGSEPQWLLISQLEHARISTELAEGCRASFGYSTRGNAQDELLEQVWQELRLAIRHHDDGWIAWEARPQVDTQHHRPPSFRELPLDESLTIWTDSIQSAFQYGPLAGWTVAQHFLALSISSESYADDPRAVTWRAETTNRCGDWLSQWQSANPRLHTPELAAEALVWLQLFDVFSLWLCSICPGSGENVANWPEAYNVGETTELAMQLQPSKPEDSADHPADVLQCNVTVDPWRFDSAELEITAEGNLVPEQPYASGQQWFEARVPYLTRWQLGPAAV